MVTAPSCVVTRPGEVTRAARTRLWVPGTGDNAQALRSRPQAKGRARPGREAQLELEGVLVFAGAAGVAAGALAALSLEPVLAAGVAVGVALELPPPESAVGGLLPLEE